MISIEKIIQSLGNRIKWLFTKEGIPFLITILAGIIFGSIFNGALGIIIATIFGLAILKLLNRLPVKFSPWQSLVSFIMPVIARICFFMVFLLPVADFLALPTGQTPDTIPNYLSVVLLKPENLFSRPDIVFPGFVILVIASIVLMFWGGMNLSRKRNLILALSGLLLFTLSPTITSILGGDFRFRFSIDVFSAGYLFAWIGLLLAALNMALPRFLKQQPAGAYNQGAFLNVIPAALAIGFVSQLNTIDLSGYVQSFTSFGFFEHTHHFIGAVFTGGAAATGAAVIVNDADTFTTSEIPYQYQPPPPLPELSLEPGDESGTTDSDDPPGTTIQHNPDGTITKTLPDGTVGTLYSDGTQYVETPDGAKGVFYPDGTTKTWDPEEGSEIHYPNGSVEVITKDGVKISGTVNDDGTIDIVSGYGGSLHIPKEGFPEGSLTDSEGNVITYNNDHSISYQTPYGTVSIDKDGNITGSIKDEEGNSFIFNPDGTMEISTSDGDSLTVDADGLKARFADGTFINTDPDGNIISCHLKDEIGSLFIDTDKNGTINFKDDQGNSGFVNKDGSGEFKDSEGSTATLDSEGNATLTNAEGITWTAKNDGSGTIEDKLGNRIDLAQDGTVTIKNADGETAVYTPDQINQMQLQGGS
ncbi:MAG: T-complex 10 C-terminal domain-containing protein [Dehalococcoidales bacterium]|nr:T-complex 10 C-terminal domain-containing protein [Dehalococcoidales bacterium]